MLVFNDCGTKPDPEHNADNIKQHGVLQPILLRPLPEGETDTYELVAGTRRYRASKLAKRESIPATVRELTDAQALAASRLLKNPSALVPSGEVTGRALFCPQCS